MEAFEEAVEAIKVGDPLDEATEMGPLISAGQRETVASLRARRRAGGDPRLAPPTGPGYWFPPTVLCPVERDDRAVTRGDLRAGRGRRSRSATRPRRSRSPTTRSTGSRARSGRATARKALRVARALETGVLSVNSNTSVRVATPFGGFKQSGVGPRARPARARALLRGQDRLLRDRHERPARAQGLRRHRRRGRHRRRDRRSASRRRARPSSASTCTDDAPGDLAIVGRRHRRGRGPRRSTRRCAREYGPHRRAVQQRRHLAARRRVGARHRRSRRGSACRTSTSSRSSCAASTGSRTCSRPAAARSSTRRRSWP